MVPEKKATKKATGTRKSARRQEVSGSSDGSEAHSSREDEEEEEDAPPSVGGDKKRKAAPTREAEGSKKGRTLPPGCSMTAAYSGDEWLPRVKPLTKL